MEHDINRTVLQSTMNVTLETSANLNLKNLTLDIRSIQSSEELSYSHEYLLTLAGVLYTALGDSLFRDLTVACGVLYTSQGLNELDVRIMSEDLPEGEGLFPGDSTND